MAHILIIGGTGMLRKVSLHFLHKGDSVSVVARPNSGKLQNLIVEAKKFKGLLHPIGVDYANKKLFKEKIVQDIRRNGQLDIVVAWVHESGERAHRILKDLFEEKRMVSYFHILGSSDVGPIKELHKYTLFPNTQHIEYKKIILGHVRDRWLTNDEISSGVIKAMKLNKKMYVVGEL